MLQKQQLDNLTIATSITASLSIICAIGTILLYVLLPRFRNAAAELVMFMAAAELIAMPAYLVGRAGPHAGSTSALCQWQAIFEQIGDLSTMLWTSCIVVDLCLIMFRGWSIQQAAWLHRRHYLAFCTLVPLVVALIPLAFKTPSGGPFYGAGDMWCWISSELPMAQLFLFYVPLWVIFAFNLVIYVTVGRHIWKRAKYLKELNSNNSGQYKMRFAKHVSLYLLAYVISRTPATIHRIHDMVYHDEQNYVLRLLHCIFTPSTGLLNFAVYAYIGWIDRMRSEERSNQLATINVGPNSNKVQYSITRQNANVNNGTILINRQTESHPGVFATATVPYVDNFVQEINAPEPFPSDASSSITHDIPSPVSPLFARIHAETWRQQQRVQNRDYDYTSDTNQFEFNVYNHHQSNIYGGHPSTRTRSAGHLR